MRKKSLIWRSFAISKNSTESHCVHATLLLDFDSKFWENPWCSSLEIVDRLSLDMDLMRGLNTINMGDTSPLRNWFVPQNGLFSYKCKWDALTWCDLTLELLKAQVEGQIDKSNGYRSHEHFQSTVFIISIHFHTSLTHSHIGLEEVINLNWHKNNNSFTCSQPDCFQQVDRVWIQYLQLMISCNRSWWIWGKRVGCRIFIFVIPYTLIHTWYCNNCTWGRKVSFEDHLLYQKNPTESHCVQHVVFLKWWLSLEMCGLSIEIIAIISWDDPTPLYDSSSCSS